MKRKKCLTNEYIKGDVVSSLNKVSLHFSSHLIFKLKSVGGEVNQKYLPVALAK